MTQDYMGPNDPFWGEMLKGFGLKDVHLMYSFDLVIENNQSPKIKTVSYASKDDHAIVERVYEIGLRSENSERASIDLVEVFRARLGLPEHVVALRVRVRPNWMPSIVCEFEPEPFDDPIIANGVHVREALAPFQLTPVLEV